jgi:hypothetical protein
MTATAVMPASPPARDARLYRDAIALTSSSLISALCGMGSWVLAARTTAPALVIAAGIGDGFTAIIPAGRDAHGVIRRGYRYLIVLALIAGVLAAVAAMTALPTVRGSFTAGALVFLGCLAWTLFAAQDSALTALGRARWLPWENGVVGLAKAGAVIALAGAFPVLWASILPAVLAVAVLYPQVRKLARRTDAQAGGSGPAGPLEPKPLGPDGARVAVTDLPSPVTELTRLVRRTTPSVALTLGSLTLLPFVVTTLAGPRTGALFTLCLSIVASLDFVSAGLGISLVVQGSADPEQRGRLARAALLRAGALVVLGGIGIVILGGRVLRLLNPAYLAMDGVAVLAILVVVSLVRVGFVIWSAHQQSKRQMRPVLILNAFAAVTLYALLPACCHRWGGVGAAVALAAAQLVLSAGAAGHVAYQAWQRRQAPLAHHHESPSSAAAASISAIAKGIS